MRRGGIIGSGISGGAGAYAGEPVVWNGSAWVAVPSGSLLQVGGDGSNCKTEIGPMAGAPTSSAALYLLTAGGTPGTATYAAASDGTNLNLNAPAGGGFVALRSGTTVLAIFDGAAGGVFSVSQGWAPGFASLTPVNGANALSAANSAVTCLNLVAGATGAVTITSATAAAKQQLVLVRNNTSQTVTFQFATGTGVSLATLTSAWITSDGTNAVKMMAGT